MKNFHLPLPDQIYTQLRAEAERHQARKVRHDAIAAYAAEVAGSNLDIDLDLEVAGIDHLLRTGKAS